MNTNVISYGYTNVVWDTKVKMELAIDRNGRDKGYNDKALQEVDDNN